MWHKWVRRGLILAGWASVISAGLYLGQWYEQQQTTPTLNIFTWIDLVPRAVLQEFTRQTGYQVNLSYYSNVEELLTKLRLTPRHSYDLIITADYAVPTLIQEQLVQPLERSQLSFWPELAPQLLNFYYDPGNQYTIPLYWDLYGLGYRPELGLKPVELSWRLIFDPLYLGTLLRPTLRLAQDKLCLCDCVRHSLWRRRKSGSAEHREAYRRATPARIVAGLPTVAPKLALLDNGLENLLIAEQYVREKTPLEEPNLLRQPAPALTPAQLAPLPALLAQQKPQVVAYTDEKAGLLLASDSVQIAVAPAAFIRRAQRQAPELQFGLPQEGGFITVESVLIARDTPKLALAYKFIELLYQPKFMQPTVDKLGYLPVFTTLLQNLDLSYLGGYQQLFSAARWQRLEFFQRRISRATVSKIWIDLKAR